jgi:import inner membrane translocase subunit TIM22
MLNASKSSAKTFAVLGAIYTANECTLEKIRGCHDSTNAIVAGCSTGAMIGARGGPQAAAISCVGFAAFGMVMERFLGTL